ncbi:hypothetical protein L1887_36257 [Cichorium endivia]|nr:hypothetical protein L1887_36257 [Cichorium endivia]
MGPSGILAVDFTALTSENSPFDLDEDSPVVVGMGASDEREGKSMLEGDLRHPRKDRSNTRREGTLDPFFCHNQTNVAPSSHQQLPDATGKLWPSPSTSSSRLLLLLCLLRSLLNQSSSIGP